MYLNISRIQDKRVLITTIATRVGKLSHIIVLYLDNYTILRNSVSVNIKKSRQKGLDDKIASSDVTREQLQRLQLLGGLCQLMWTRQFADMLPILVRCLGSDGLKDDC
jgi:hypothetical protein